MAIIPQSKPKDIKAGDKITAKWLNKSKNTIANLSASAPLQVSQANGNFNISHAPHGPAVRWGRVVQQFHYTTDTTVLVDPIEFSMGSDFEYKQVISSDYSQRVSVYVTNPISNVVSDISDLTKNLVIDKGNIISYMWFGDKYGTMMGSAPTPRDPIYYGRLQSDISGPTKKEFLTVRPCDEDGNIINPPISDSLFDFLVDISTSFIKGKAATVPAITTSDVIQYHPRNGDGIVGTVLGLQTQQTQLLDSDFLSDVFTCQPGGGKLITGYADRWGVLHEPSDESVLIGSSTSLDWITPPQTSEYFLRSNAGDIGWTESTSYTHRLIDPDTHYDTEGHPITGNIPTAGGLIYGKSYGIGSDSKWTIKEASLYPSVFITASQGSPFWATPAQTGVFSLKSSDGNISWGEVSDITTTLPHKLLSDVHTDTIANAPTAGDIILGTTVGGSDFWDVLPVTPTGEYNLTSVEGVVTWEAKPSDTSSDIGPHKLLSDVHTDTIANAPTAGDIILGTTVGGSDFWDVLPQGNPYDSLIVSSDGDVVWKDYIAPGHNSGALLVWDDINQKYYSLHAPAHSDGYVHTLVSGVGDNFSDTQWKIGAILDSDCHIDARTETTVAGSILRASSDTTFSQVYAPADYGVFINRSDDVGFGYVVPEQTGLSYLTSSDGIISWGEFSDYNNLLDGEKHSDTVAATASKGSFIVGNTAEKWEKLAAPAQTSLLLNSNTSTSWSTPPQTGEYRIISNAGTLGWEAKQHNMLDGDDHPDTVANSPARGSVVVGNSNSKWSSLAKGNEYDLFMCNSTDAGWYQYIAPGDSYGDMLYWSSNKYVKLAAPTAAGPQVLTYIDDVSYGWRIQNLLDSHAHLDTRTSTCAQGSIIRGDSSLKWNDVPAPADDSVFINSRTAKSWATPPQSGTYFLKSVDGDISWVAMTAVPVVVDVQATGSALQQKTTTVYVEKEVVGAYSDIIAISDCD